MPPSMPHSLWILLELDYGTKMSPLIGREGRRWRERERERERESRWARGQQSKVERESGTGREEAREKKTMERAPRPEMGQVWGRSWTEAGVSTHRHTPSALFAAFWSGCVCENLKADTSLLIQFGFMARAKLMCVWVCVCICVLFTYQRTIM